MTKKDYSTLSGRLMLACIATGAASAEAVEGVYEHNPGKVLVAFAFMVVTGLFAHFIDNNLLDSIHSRR